MKGDSGGELDRLALVSGSILRAAAGIESAKSRMKDAKAAAKSHGFAVKPLLAALKERGLSAEALDEKRKQEEEFVQLRGLYRERLNELPLPLEEYIADQVAAGFEDVEE